MFDVPAEKIKKVINFLGFTFDGKKISIRAKTVGKYYYRMYGKARTIKRNKGYSPKGNRISAKNLYATYSKKALTDTILNRKMGLKNGIPGIFCHTFGEQKRNSEKTN